MSFFIELGSAVRPAIGRVCVCVRVFTSVSECCVRLVQHCAAHGDWAVRLSRFSPVISFISFSVVSYSYCSPNFDLALSQEQQRTYRSKGDGWTAGEDALPVVSESQSRSRIARSLARCLLARLLWLRVLVFQLSSAAYTAPLLHELRSVTAPRCSHLYLYQ